MSPTVSVLLRVGNPREIYCTSKCLSTYSKYPQLNDSHDSQSPRATGHAGGRNSSGHPAHLSRTLGTTVPIYTTDTASGPLTQSLAPLASPRLWGHCSRIWADASSCSIFTKALWQKRHCLSVISLMPFSITKPQLHSSVITKGSRMWFSGGLALAPPSPS